MSNERYIHMRFFNFLIRILLKGEEGKMVRVVFTGGGIGVPSSFWLRQKKIRQPALSNLPFSSFGAISWIEWIFLLLRSKSCYRGQNNILPAMVLFPFYGFGIIKNLIFDVSNESFFFPYTVWIMLFASVDTHAVSVASVPRVTKNGQKKEKKREKIEFVIDFPWPKHKNI